MLKFLLFPFSVIYSVISKFRNLFYNFNIFKSQYFKNVITVGNITVGGTGKTPHTEYLLNLLKKKKKIAVLSRGYKRKTKGFLYVNNKSTYKQVGDEPLQIFKKNQDIDVAVCESRTEGINKIISEKKSEIIILDDGFQHRKVKPKFSILLTTYSNPFFKDIFLPAGRLRDNKSEYSRAKIIVVTKCDKNIKFEEKKIWKNKLKLKPYQELYFSTEKYLTPVNIATFEKINTKTNLENYFILIISGIANSKNFVDYVKNNYSKKIKHLNFGDHHNFSQKDINKIEKIYSSISGKKIIITTEKDAMRLVNFNFSPEIKTNIFYQPIEIDFLFNEKEKFDNKIIELLKTETPMTKKNLDI